MESKIKRELWQMLKALIPWAVLLLLLMGLARIDAAAMDRIMAFIVDLIVPAS